MGFLPLGLGLGMHAGPAWTPASISSKVAYWLRADLGVNAGAKTWTDQVNNIMFSATALSTDTSGINGQARVKFAGPGSANNTLSATFTPGVITKCQAFIIGKTGVVASNAIWNIGGNQGSYFPYIDGKIYEDACSTGRYGSITDPQGLTGGSFAYEVKADASGNWSAIFNGTVISTQTGNVPALNGSPQIGAGAVVYVGDIGEVLVLHDNMTSGEHASWVAYVLARYGIAA